MTLYEAQKAILDSLTAAVRALWSPKAIEYALPDTFGGGCPLPIAYIVLTNERSAEGDPRVDRCGGWVLVDIEIHLRECRAREGTEWMARNKMRRTSQLRQKLFGSTRPASYLGHEARWKGGTIQAAGDLSDTGAGSATVRTVLRFDLLVETEDALY